MVESRHRGSAVGLDASCAVAFRVGDVDAPVYGRSANKPLQATAMVELGLELPPPQLALVCASHNGEPAHVAGVRAILASAGLDEGLLRNTAAYPLHEPSAADVIRAGGRRAAILQNCSGKHTGMLVTCAVNGWALDSYLDQDHPLQRHITTVVERLGGEAVAHVGIDGCGAPAHTLTLTGLARAFAAVAAAPAGSPMAAVRAAMTTHPDMVGGTGRDVTALMEAVPGLVAKDGAEGVLARGAARRAGGRPQAGRRVVAGVRGRRARRCSTGWAPTPPARRRAAPGRRCSVAAWRGRALACRHGASQRRRSGARFRRSGLRALSPVSGVPGSAVGFTPARREAPLKARSGRRRW